MKTIKNTIVISLIILFAACSGNKDKEALVLYCAAGIKPPIEKIAREYSEEYGVDINIQYGGSGTLLSNIRISQSGDLFLAADESYIDEASKYGLIAENQPLAIITPVIAVKKGNPKKINGINDLTDNDIRYALGNPDAASIGKHTRIIFENMGIWDKIKAQVTVMKPTVNDVANDIRIGSVDAGIIWNSTAAQYKDIDILNPGLFSEYNKHVCIGVLNTSEQPTEALRFMRYLSSRDKGNQVFSENGFVPIKGDKWEKKPSIVFFSGGVNRVAIEETIKEFEDREGVDVTRVYNGCGILVSQMKAGQQPDAYLSCDVSFMTQVEDRFTNIADISKTDIVIAVQKDNPKNITQLKDLQKRDMRLGACNPKQSALGALTQNMLKDMGLWEGVVKNIYSQTPTADLLVNQLRTGSLDAVIVYRANVSQVLDKLTVVDINDQRAMAIQNFGISTESDFGWLTRRLIDAISSKESKEKYLKNGFDWQLDSLQLSN
jgi:molybdenum ABC transporter molybdate-binding protein